jgi:hypothetical protein
MKLREVMDIVIKWIFSVSKFFVFVSFFLTALVMYKLDNVVLSGIILLVLSLYLIYHKIDSIDRRLRKIENEMSTLR